MPTLTEEEKLAALFIEAKEQLEAVLNETENAVFSIMDLIEKQMENQDPAKELLQKKRLSADKKSQLLEKNESLTVDMTEMITLLSFQDLAGQRTKKAMDRLEQIKASFEQNYNIILPQVQSKANEQNALSSNAINELTSQEVKNSELKGPTAGVDQASVDALLDQLF